MIASADRIPRWGRVFDGDRGSEERPSPRRRSARSRVPPSSWTLRDQDLVDPFHQGVGVFGAELRGQGRNPSRSAEEDRTCRSWPSMRVALDEEPSRSRPADGGWRLGMGTGKRGFGAALGTSATAWRSVTDFAAAGSFLPHPGHWTRQLLSALEAEGSSLALSRGPQDWQRIGIPQTVGCVATHHIPDSAATSAAQRRPRPAREPGPS